MARWSQTGLIPVPKPSTEQIPRFFSSPKTQSSTRRAARVSPVAPMTGEPAAKKMEGPTPSNPSKSSKQDHHLPPPSNPSKWGGGLGPPSNPSKCPSKSADAPGPYPPPLHKLCSTYVTNPAEHYVESPHGKY